MNQPNLTRTITRAEAWLREAKQATVPCGVKPANQSEARRKLAMAVKELEAAL